LKLPRDISGLELARLLSAFGYKITRQAGSYIRLTTSEMGEHHITIPNHQSLRIGTLASIVREVAQHFEVEREEAVRKIFRRN